MIKTFVVYLPTGEIFIKADRVERTIFNNKDILIFRRDDDEKFLQPAAVFNLDNIYGWSEYHA